MPIRQAEALIYGAFKSGRNQATGSGGDNAPLLIIPTTTTHHQRVTLLGET